MLVMAGAPNSVVCVSVRWVEFEATFVVLEWRSLMFGELERIVGSRGRRGWWCGCR